VLLRHGTHHAAYGVLSAMAMKESTGSGNRQVPFPDHVYVEI
jgi:hypothetical protein